MQLAVHTKIEIPDGLIDEYTRRGASVRVGSHSHSFSGHGGWGAAREGSKFQNRNYRGLNVLSGKNWSGGQALAQDQAYDVGGSEHGSKEQSESDVERSGWKRSFSIQTRLDHFARQIEDEAYAKLRNLGVPLLEREDLQALLNEHDLAAESHFEKMEYGLCCVPPTRPPLKWDRVRRPTRAGFPCVWLTCQERYYGRDPRTNCCATGQTKTTTSWTLAKSRCSIRPRPKRDASNCR